MRKNKQNNNMVFMNIGVDILENILSFLLLRFEPNKRFIKNINKLFALLDVKAFEKSDYEINLFKAITHAAAARLSGATETPYLINYIHSATMDEGFMNSVHHILDMKKDLPTEAYNHLDTLISQQLEYIFLWQIKPVLYEFYNNFSFGGYVGLTERIEPLKQNLEYLLGELKRVEKNKEMEKTIHFNGEMNQDVIYDLSTVYDELTDPSCVYKVGLQEINRLVGGGFHRRRFYNFYGPTNNFKSGLLLYLALWMMQFNPNAKPRVPDKKLLIILVTMENDSTDTYDRTFSIYTSGTVRTSKISKAQYLEEWKHILRQMTTNIELVILYKPPRQKVGDLKIIKDEWEDMGYEVLSMVVDHMGNMVPTENIPSKNEALEAVAYELSDFAKSENLILISGKHTSSNFDKELVTMKEQGKTNLVRFMGRHCIGDATYIDRAVDKSIYILMERSPVDGRIFLGFKREKVRQERDSGSDVFYHPLINNIGLQADLLLPNPLSVKCIPGTEANSMVGGMGGGMFGVTPTPFDNSLMGQGGIFPIMQQPYVPYQDPAISQVEPLLDLGDVSIPIDTSYDELISDLEIVGVDDENDVSEDDFIDDDNSLIEDIENGIDDDEE